jgi:hypothetical protein
MTLLDAGWPTVQFGLTHLMRTAVWVAHTFGSRFRHQELLEAVHHHQIVWG